MKKQIFGTAFAIVVAAIGIIFPFAQISPEKTIIYYDNFEGGTFKWAQSPYGVCELSDFNAYYGDQSMNITAYPWCNQEALRMIGTPNGSLSRVILDFRFSAPHDYFSYFCFGLEISSIHKDTAYYYAIQFPQGNYLDENDTWSPVAGMNSYGWDLSNDYEIWHHAQLVVNFETGEYLSATIDDCTVDLENLGYIAHEKPKYFWGIIYSWFYVGALDYSCGVLVDEVTLYLENI